MADYDYKKLMEYHYSLGEMKKVFEEAAKGSGVVKEGIAAEYEDLVDDSDDDLPDLLKSFSRREYFSHNNNGKSNYYDADGIKAHIARNMGKLRASIEDSAHTPVTETRSFDFISEPRIKKILERDYQEIQRGLISDSWKSVIILSGGSIEAILLDSLKKKEDKAKSSSKAPESSNLDKWELNDIIEVAMDIEVAGPEIARLSHTAREYRNLVHPGYEIRKDLKVEPEEAKIAVEVLHIIIRELS